MIEECLSVERTKDENDIRYVHAFIGPREEILKIASMCYKNPLQLHVQQTNGKAATLKDLTNIKTAMDNKFIKNDISAVVKQLKEIKGKKKVSNSLKE